jgi:hypothetical protein
MSALATLLLSVACNTSAVQPLAWKPSFNYGNRRIAVALPPRATYLVVPEGEPGMAWLQDDGWIRTKVGWWTAHGKPRVTGRRIDAAAKPLRAEIGPLSASANTTFYPSGLYFPSTGCWRITATAGGARLVATVKVVRQ